MRARSTTPITDAVLMGLVLLAFAALGYTWAVAAYRIVFHP